MPNVMEKPAAFADDEPEEVCARGGGDGDGLVADVALSRTVGHGMGHSTRPAGTGGECAVVQAWALAGASCSSYWCCAAAAAAAAAAHHLFRTHVGGGLANTRSAEGGPGLACLQHTRAAWLDGDLPSRPALVWAERAPFSDTLPAASQHSSKRGWGVALCGGGAQGSISVELRA